MEASRRLVQQEHDRIFGSTQEMDNFRRTLQNKNKNNRNAEEDEDEDAEGNETEQTDEVDAPVIYVAEEDNSTNQEEEEMEESNPEPVKAIVRESRIDLVKLVPFDVKLSLITEAGDGLNTFALTDIVSQWMEESIAAEVKRMELGLTHSVFDSVILEDRGLTHGTATVNDGSSATTSKTSALLTANHNIRRKLQVSHSIASYEGVTLWKHTTSSNLQIMTPSLLEDFERQALLQDDRLLEVLQASPAEGLGDQVQQVRAYINPNPTNYVPFQNLSSDTTNRTTTTTNANLELIIVVAIVVACMAFAFLVFSLFWAWRFDQQRRDAAYRVDSTPAPSKTASKKNQSNASTIHGVDVTNDYEEDCKTPANMNTLVKGNQDDETTLQYVTSETNATTGVYPESVMSEDISTSLSAYYRSGMGSRPLYGSRTLGTNEFNDQASFSSMESYGYSLDGYAPSLGGNTFTNSGTARPQSEAGDEQGNP